ncbi:Uncharacterised protein [Legionella pneumophila]|nr:Uncharacterised protein [Legionella pneumophila]
MTIHVFTTTIEQALNPTICIKTQKSIKSELSLKGSCGRTTKSVNSERSHQLSYMITQRWKFKLT